MIKGVNKQVVDVTEPDSAYFERVLFFVKPEYSGLGESVLRRKADQLLSDAGSGKVAGPKRPQRKKLRGALIVALAAALSAALTAAVLLAALR